MLEALFAEARAEAPAPSGAFLDRIMADAEAELAAASAPAPAAPARRGPLRAFVSALAGGWAGLGGLVAATGAGLWIGLAPPALVQDLAPGLYGDTASAPFVYDQADFWTEEDA